MINKGVLADIPSSPVKWKLLQQLQINRNPL